jgi:hypothetical protein
MPTIAFHLAAALLTFGSAITLPPLDLHASDFTIATYVFLNDTQRRNIVLGNWSSRNHAWQMLFAVNGDGRTAVNLRRDMRTDGSDPFQDLVALNGQTALAPRQWQHIAVTFSWGPDRKSPVATLYVNGRADASATPHVQQDWRVQNPYTLKRSPNAYVIGHKEDTNTQDDWFNGQLCEYRIYTRALSAEQLQAMVSRSGMPPKQCMTAEPWEITPRALPDWQ